MSLLLNTLESQHLPLNVPKIEFDFCFLSAILFMPPLVAIGRVLPDLSFCRLLVNSFDQKFDEIYMIDDSEKNLKNLDKLNIKGILYTNNEKLFEQLNAYL